MKNAYFFLLSVLLLTASCGQDDNPEDYDWLIIPTPSKMNIMGVSERDGEISIYGSHIFDQDINYRYHDLIDPSCLTISDYEESLIERVEIPIYATLDVNRRNWKIRDDFKSNIKAVHFLTEEIGFIQTYLEGLFKTTDGGTNWTKILKGQVSNDCIVRFPLRFRHILFKSENQGFAIDPSHNYIISTSNSGERWHPFIGEGSDYISNVHDLETVPNAETLYLKTYSSGGYLKSIDTGVSWSDDIVEGNADDLEFLTNQIGFYINDSRIYKTETGVFRGDLFLLRINPG